MRFLLVVSHGTQSACEFDKLINESAHNLARAQSEQSTPWWSSVPRIKDGRRH